MRCAKSWILQRFYGGIILFKKIDMPISETHNIDCMEFMAGLPDGYFDLVIADPDFGLNEKIANGGTWAAKYKKFDGNLGGKPDGSFWKELFRTSKNQIVWGGNYFVLPETRCFIIWDKVAHMDTLADCEMAWTSFDSNAKIFQHGRNTSEKRVHICQKPVALYKWLLTNYAKPGHKIFDPMMGSQSSRIAAWDMGFDYYGCELDADYYRDGETRFAAHIAKPVLFAPEQMYNFEQATLF